MQLRNALLIIVVLFSHDMLSMFTNGSENMQTLQQREKLKTIADRDFPLSTYVKTLLKHPCYNSITYSILQKRDSMANELIVLLEQQIEPEKTYADYVHNRVLYQQLLSNVIAGSFALGTLGGFYKTYTAAREAAAGYGIFTACSMMLTTFGFRILSTINHYEMYDKTQPIPLTSKQEKENTECQQKIEKLKEEYTKWEAAVVNFVAEKQITEKLEEWSEHITNLGPQQ